MHIYTLDRVFQQHEILVHEYQLLQVNPAKHIHEVKDKNVFVLFEWIVFLEV